MFVILSDVTVLWACEDETKYNLKHATQVSIVQRTNHFSASDDSVLYKGGDKGGVSDCRRLCSIDGLRISQAVGVVDLETL